MRSVSAGCARGPGVRLAVDPDLVEGPFEPMVRLHYGFEELPELAGLERWLGERLSRARGKAMRLSELLGAEVVDRSGSWLRARSPTFT